MERTYSCSNPDKCPWCGNEDMNIYEEYEEE